MSDATPHDPHHAHHEPNHEGPIRTPKQLILAVLFSFLVPIFGIVLLVNYVYHQSSAPAGSDALGPEAVAARIQPVGQVVVKDLSDAGALKTGEQAFNAQCAACHAAGLAGAPKLGDAAAWGPRIKTGYEALLTSALKGKGAMGAQGGGDLSDLEIGRAVVHMANAGGAKFEEPKAPAAAGAAAPAATAAPVAAPVAAAPAPAATPVAAAAAPAAKADATPALYTQNCAVCHAAGVAGAPKLGDKAAWTPRLATGVDGLTASAIKGKGAMPPKGGAVAASDADIKAVVAYMVGTVK
ncbi:c-type cytochrome [Rivibacter subsaxonicus]|uniref:Cytochrome c5 n=1 Tax=Rivibacter subsaxonicus TaxID=457575 RepID=A0A4Q7VWT0_9BURK|nr:c-type cytochrome [Rivibacter subsaxonicus]RZU01140.1 cytochrome c5 [Rivibacter subsaxonicus]